MRFDLSNRYSFPAADPRQNPRTVRPRRPRSIVRLTRASLTAACYAPWNVWIPCDPRLTDWREKHNSMRVL